MCLHFGWVEQGLFAQVMCGQGQSTLAGKVWTGAVCSLDWCGHGLSAQVMCGHGRLHLLGMCGLELSAVWMDVDRGCPRKPCVDRACVCLQFGYMWTGAVCASQVWTGAVDTF